MSMNDPRRARAQRQERAGRTLLAVFMAVLFVGLFVQIAMVARLARQNKEIQRVATEIRDLSATADNLELSLSHYQSPDRVAKQAERLGMEQPAEGQIRVVSVPEIIEDTSAQGAGTGAGNP